MHETASGRAPPMGRLSGDYSVMGSEVLAQLSAPARPVNTPLIAPQGARTCDGSSILAIGGWDGSCNLNSFERLGAGGGASWALVGSLSSSRRGLACAAIGGSVFVIGGWDGSSYLSSVEVCSAPV